MPSRAALPDGRGGVRWGHCHATRPAEPSSRAARAVRRVVACGRGISAGMGGSHPRVVQCPAAQVHHGGRDLGKAQHFAAIFSSKLFRVGLLRKAADGGAHGAVALAAHYVEGGLAVDPVAPWCVPVGLAHVLHIHGLHGTHLLTGQQGAEQLHRVAEERGLVLPRKAHLRLGAGVVGQQHAVEFAAGGAVDLLGLERLRAVVRLAAARRTTARNLSSPRRSTAPPAANSTACCWPTTPAPRRRCALRGRTSPRSSATRWSGSAPCWPVSRCVPCRPCMCRTWARPPGTHHGATGSTARPPST